MAKGDEILRKIAGCLLTVFSSSDSVICRNNAYTFLVYCTHRDDYTLITDKVSEVCCDMPTSVKLRIGVYSSCDKKLDVRARFDRAKIAADLIRNNYSVFISTFDETLMENEFFAEQLVDEFPKALAEKQFKVFFQPKFNIEGDKPVLSSAEALVRWFHPTLGMISPGKFIPLFEEDGLISQLDEYIWRCAAETIADWKMPEMDGIEVARQIRQRYAKETTVIILTSFNWDEIMEEAIHAGVDSFLAKPLFASNVIDEFERIARKNSMTLFKEKSRADLKGRHILMAEDVLINAEIMEQIIMVRGAGIDHAENGKIVLDMFNKSEEGYYDAILMDVRMPEMDGLAATETIRALDRSDAKKIPIIAMTANAFDEDVQRSLQVGMNAHLSKPVEPDRLYQTLEELIWEYDQAKNNKAE